MTFLSHYFRPLLGTVMNFIRPFLTSWSVPLFKPSATVLNRLSSTQQFIPTVQNRQSSGLKIYKPHDPTRLGTKIRVYYKGSAWKRYNQGCIEKRLTKPGGIDILWRKTLRGKHQLATFERILPNMPTMKKHGQIVKECNLKFRDHPITRNKLPERKFWFETKYKDRRR